MESSEELWDWLDTPGKFLGSAGCARGLCLKASSAGGGAHLLSSLQGTWLDKIEKAKRLPIRG